MASTTPALAQLEAHIGDVKASQRAALRHLIEVAQQQPDHAQALADEIVDTWTVGVLQMLQASLLGRAERGGHA